VIDAHPEPEPTLVATLERAATRVTDGQAAVACAAGTVATAAILLFATPWWRLALATLCMAAFSAWVIAARSHLAPRLKDFLRGTCLFVGVGGTFVFGLSLLALALGIWIS